MDNFDELAKLRDKLLNLQETFSSETGEVDYEDILKDGDCSITLYGGHTYEALEEGTLVYEFKTGPYEGQELDKRFIE